ncbi:hypothetical protein PGUG_04498 [Meyerozyma guilliermondii ATCC 6260]|uniref:Uncharacterized protein n=1 Tax=Meyerozyma guilliermondii (strain ATCC 6260 / CBS 566 / DSM 6381 / JCM 1539 / NBRC 10279 / NRRL Y-324) TaxID=294746 RepID=A5DMJ7_PICGU|nr:uncharacterized protein PGUG_04498 [Meyerozyma guilliermondii ATCC 6260]EDK40400.2 hypothetical protein PGUG_04498 [Meyerozyma guilliermondii ATCC 6260]
MGLEHAKIFGESVGYGMVVGVGFAFAVIMVGVTKLLSVFFNEIQDSEMLMTAKRSIKTGLIASAVISSWTIGSTLLLSCTAAYSNGISSAYWYGAGACVQIIFFSMLALEIKKKAPNCHTYQEVVRTRYGAPTHIVSIVYSVIQMVCYTTNLLINGSSIFSAITGMNRDAAIVLFPIGVIIYTLMGGIKATFPYRSDSHRHFISSCACISIQSLCNSATSWAPSVPCGIFWWKLSKGGLSSGMLWGAC